MKFIHLSDLHLGKRVNGFSMLDDQAYILEEILAVIRRERPQAVLLAGDIYDQGVPPEGAVRLFSSFLESLAALETSVFVSSGNHDSAGRLAFAAPLLAGGGVYISPAYAGTLSPITLWDEYGPVEVWMLPFVKPGTVRALLPEEEREAVGSYTEAVARALSACPQSEGQRRVLLAHQFVTGAERSESEQPLSVGGTEAVAASVFNGFHYVALGHLHIAQNVGSPALRYCGAPLAYSFSEAEGEGGAPREKSVTVVELGEGGEAAVRTVPLRPLHPLRRLRGAYAALTARSFYEGTGLQDCYVEITLTDENEEPNALQKLRTVYPLLMRLVIDNARTRAAGVLALPEIGQTESPAGLFAEFYERQNGAPPSPSQRALAESKIDAIWLEEEA